jgi:molecular chaperone DnaJ
MQRINRAYEQIRVSAFGIAANDDKPPSAPAAADEAPGRTVRRKVRLTLEEAALGCTKVLRGKLVDTCATCDGDGSLKPPVACKRCEGAGTVRESAWYGWLSTRTACGACDGSGVVRQTCHACEGRGKHTSTYRRTVRIPAGVRQDDVLGADGGGDAKGSFDGHLELHVALSAHAFFVPGENGTLHCEMPVSGFAWIADAWIDVPTLSGLQQMRLRRGRHVYRLRGQGLPLERRGSARGDYVVKVVPVFPEALSPEQEALLAQLAQLESAPAAEDARMLAWRRTLRAWNRGQPKDAGARSH